MDKELEFIKSALQEENNIANIYNNNKYNGWYRYISETEEKNKIFVDTVIIFRLPKTLKIYNDILRNFTKEERLAGIHRMLIGKDLQEELKEFLKHENVNDYIETLNDEEVKSLLDKMKNIITFDCNKIPYLYFRQFKEKVNEEEQNRVIKNFLDNQKDYLKIFKDVLNEKITKEEAFTLSEGIIFNEAINIHQGK